MSVIVHLSGVPGFFAPAPAFTFFEHAISGQLVNFQIFDDLGGGWYKFKRMEVDFYAPGWLTGYSDVDVMSTLVMARTIRNEVLGVVW